MSARTEIHLFHGLAAYLQASRSRPVPTWPFIAYMALIGGAISAVLILGFYLQLSALQLVVFVCTAGALAGTLLFTLMDVFRLQRHKD